MTTAVAAATAAAVLGPLLGYFAAHRKLSGKIDTTEAEQLWAESRAMRDDYRAQLSAALERTVGLEMRIANLEADNHTLARANVALREKVSEDEARIAELQARVDEQARTIAGLQRRVTDLQHELEKERAQ